MCFGDLQVDKVSEALMKIFGPDHVPNHKDIVRATKNLGHTTGQEDVHYIQEYGNSESFPEQFDMSYDDGSWEDEYDEYSYAEDAYYADEFWDESYEDGAYEYEYDDQAEEEVVPELEEAADKTEEAYMGYLEARKRCAKLPTHEAFTPSLP